MNNKHIIECPHCGEAIDLRDGFMEQLNAELHISHKQELLTLKSNYESDFANKIKEQAELSRLQTQAEMDKLKTQILKQQREKEALEATVALRYEEKLDSKPRQLRKK